MVTPSGSDSNYIIINGCGFRSKLFSRPRAPPFLKSWLRHYEVRSRCGRGTVEVLSRFGRGAACHSMVAVRSRYSLGMLPVRSWYGILKVRSRLVFSTRLEPGTRTVRFIVRIAQSRLSWIRFGHRYYTLRNIVYSIYGLADSDRDNKLSVILIHYYTVYLGWHQGGVKDHAGLHWCG